MWKLGVVSCDADSRWGLDRDRLRPRNRPQEVPSLVPKKMKMSPGKIDWLFSISSIVRTRHLHRKKLNDIIYTLYTKVNSKLTSLKIKPKHNISESGVVS